MVGPPKNHSPRRKNKAVTKKGSEASPKKRPITLSVLDEINQTLERLGQIFIGIRQVLIIQTIPRQNVVLDHLRPNVNIVLRVLQLVGQIALGVLFEINAQIPFVLDLE
jgi:hypothetical protein